MSNEFEDKPAVRSRVPLLLGIVGPSSSGKTFSALRLATGMQRVIGGDIFFIDTEHERGLHYADHFKFRHVDFKPPFSPLRYLAAIEHCVRKGAKILVIDSMTHEHSGEGGVMDQSEKMLDRKCGDDWKAREKNLMLSLVRPKAERKKLNNAIVQLGINAVLCYRAQDKIKPVRGGEPLKLGWQPETTSPLHYDMTQRFLLTPGCDGVPSLIGDTEAEKRMVKNPAMFRDLFKIGQPLDEDTGEALARWAAGSSAPSPLDGLIGRLVACDRAAVDGLKAEARALFKRLSADDRERLKVAIAATESRLDAAQPDALFGDRATNLPG